MASSFRFDMSALERGLELHEDKVLSAVMKLADDGSQMMENYAKEHKRWQNRTGHAVQRLKGDFFPIKNGVKIRLAHGVDYGIWLELANEKKYSIIPETIQIVGETEVMPAFENLMEKVKR